MKNNSKGKIVFDFRRFLTLMIVSFVGFLGFWFWQSSNQKMPTSKELESSIQVSKTDSTTAQSSEAQTETSSSQSVPAEDPKIEAIKTELKSRKSRAEQIAKNDAGVLYVDESYGGSQTESDSEMPIAKFSIPSLGMEREIWQGVGVSSNGVAGFGDDNRLYRAATYRADQTLGGDNFTVVSHIWSGQNAFGKDFTNEWFSPLLTSVDGGMTTDLAKLKIKKGDKIVVQEFSTGLIFEFEISEIKTAVKAGSDGLISAEVKELLLPRIDQPRITLQGCLMNTNQLFFVVGELLSVEKEGVKLQLK